MAAAELSIFLSHLDHVLEGRNARLLEIARTAEDEGADQVVLSEHVALASVIAGEGEAAIFPFPPEENYPEPVTTLAAIAGVTTSLRLATGILIAPLRNAPLLAKAVATLDHLSEERLDLGLGSGWHVPELWSAGVDPASRLAVLEETLLACRELWSAGPASFDGRHVKFDNLNCVPKPLSGANLPVSLAGPPTPAGLDRVARLGQGWLPLGNLDADAIPPGRGHLAAAAGRHAKPETSYTIRAPLAETTGRALDDALDLSFANARRMIDAGATHLQLPLWCFVKRLDDVGPVVAGARARIDAL